jgi:hypothetical protein
VIEFNKPINPITVDADTIRVFAEKKPGVFEPFPGRLEVEKNRVVFYPTVPPHETQIAGLPVNVEGFLPNTRYKVVVPDFFVSLSSTIKSLDKLEPLGQSFQGFFKTNNAYEDEWTQPAALYINVMEVLGSNSSTGVVSVKFSESMKKESLPGEMALIHPLRGPVAASCFPNQDYSLFTLVPQEELTGEDLVLEYSLQLGRGITDLAGNPLLSFHTGLLSLSPPLHKKNTGLIYEDFSTQTWMDERETSLKWDSPEMPGYLSSAPGMKVLDVRAEGPLADEEEPFWSRTPQSIQLLLPAEQLGPRGILEEIGWIPAEESFTPSFLSNVKVSIGYEDSAMTEAGFLPTYSPSVTADGYLPLPFAQPFPFDGRSDILIEISHDGGRGSIAWKLWDDREYALRIKINHEEQKGQSLFYDTGTLHPRFSIPVVTSKCNFSSICMEENFSLRFQGMQDKSVEPFKENTPSSSFTGEIEFLGNHRYIRFRIDFLTGDPSFQVDSISIPYNW